MNLGKVVGTVVSTQKEASMDGLRFMLVKHVDPEGKETGGNVVAVDAVGAGPGEYVLVCTGSSARQTHATDKRPCDAVIMAIVDSWETNGAEKYRKGQ
jgi:microcompartment protein CcmK/EutM